MPSNHPITRFWRAALHVAVLPVMLALAGCVTAPAVVPPIELSIFSINDFHGHIQPQPAGGIAYLATVLNQLRDKRPHQVFVGAGDLIGASPQMSALLKDEPTLSALGELGLVATALGNHELDHGVQELLRKTHGECPSKGCDWPGFKGATFPYLAANMFDTATGKRVLPSHVMKDMAGLKIAFVGVVTRDTPKVVVPSSIAGLRFADEADTLNALVPELHAAGAQVLVALIHEGAMYDGAANDPSYACPGLKGRGVDIAKRLDPAYAIIISGHTHQAYTCKINGRLMVQAGSYGGWLTESRLTLDANGKVLDAQATNYPVLQGVNAPNPAFAALVQRAAALTLVARSQPVATLKRGANRQVAAPYGDSPLGNLVADSQLAYAKKHGGADIGLTNSGGIRADLVVVPGRMITHSDVFAIQPFGNELIALTISGAQLKALIRRQLPPRREGGPTTLQVSNNLRYQWSQAPGTGVVLDAITVDGKPLDPYRDYRIVANNFTAEGGDELSILRQGRDRAAIGPDIDALVEWLSDNPAAMDQIDSGRIQRN